MKVFGSGLRGLLQTARVLEHCAFTDYKLGEWSGRFKVWAQSNATEVRRVMANKDLLPADRSALAQMWATDAYSYGRRAELCRRLYERRLARRAREGK